MIALPREDLQALEGYHSAQVDVPMPDLGRFDQLLGGRDVDPATAHEGARALELAA